jgi:hypothetical protein
MLQNKQDILLVIVIILIGYSIFNTNSIRTDVKGYKAEIELLQTKVDSAKVITIIKNQTNEKATNAGKFSNVELEQFFTSRYNKNLTAN